MKTSIKFKKPRSRMYSAVCSQVTLREG